MGRDCGPGERPYTTFRDAITFCSFGLTFINDFRLFTAPPIYVSGFGTIGPRTRGKP